MKAKVGFCQSPARALGLALAGKSRLDPVPTLPDTRPWHLFPVLTQTQGALPILSNKPTNQTQYLVTTMAGTRKSDGFSQLMAPRAGALCLAIWDTNTNSSSRILEWNKCRIHFCSSFTLLLRVCGLRQAGLAGLGQYLLC